jgi:hypothetical protein
MQFMGVFIEATSRICWILGYLVHMEAMTWSDRVFHAHFGFSQTTILVLWEILKKDSDYEFHVEHVL